MYRSIPVCILLTLVACARPEHNPPYDPEEAYHQLLAGLDPEHPGRGQDVFDERRQDRCMAYGLILRAEANRFEHTGDSAALARVRSCGQWLVANVDRDGDGVPGYGLADAWDAFNDSTVNPPGQVCVITTSMAVQALHDWLDLGTDTVLHDTIRGTIRASLSHWFSREFDSRMGIPSYLFLEPERPHLRYVQSRHPLGRSATAVCSAMW